MLALLPTNQDNLEKAASIISTLSKDIHDLKEQIDSIDNCVSMVETTMLALQACMVALKEVQEWQHHTLTMIHLLIDNRKNCSHRNNIRLWGIPEATSGGETSKPWLLPS